MLNYEELERVKTLLTEVESKSIKVELYYVVCLFRSPITRHIERRYGLFADPCEAQHFYKMLRETYEETIPTQFWIDSNVSFLGMQDHGLVGEKITQDDDFIEDLIREQGEQM
jgi:hypothetical protein